MSIADYSQVDDYAVLWQIYLIKEKLISLST